MASEIQIQVVSDLHLETPASRPTYSDFDVESGSHYLALLGDIGNVVHPGLSDFLERQLRRFRVVFFLLGNHEAYGTTYQHAKRIMSEIEARITRLRSVEPQMGRLVLLDKTRFDLSPNITVLGCTLFSCISDAQKPTTAMFISDFQNVQDWSVEKHNQAHAADLAYLNNQVREIVKTEPHRQIVIFTLYFPTRLPEANDPIHLKDDRQVNSAFCTDLSKQICWTSPNVVLWAFGHTHFNCDFNEGSTGKRIMANQKGYRRSEAVNFDASKIVSILDTPRRRVSADTSNIKAARRDGANRCIVS